jgi:hypothetical protein
MTLMGQHLTHTGQFGPDQSSLRPATGRKNGFAVRVGMLNTASMNSGVGCRHKFKEEHDMTSKEVRDRKL